MGKTKKALQTRNWSIREQHNVALTLDVTAKAHSNGYTEIVADYNHVYLFDGFAAQIVKPKLPVGHNWTDLSFALIAGDKYVFGEYVTGCKRPQVSLQPFLTLPMIFNLPLKIPVPTKSKFRVELYNEESIPVTVRFSFVGEGVRDIQ